MPGDRYDDARAAFCDDVALAIADALKAGISEADILADFEAALSIADHADDIEAWERADAEITITSAGVMIGPIQWWRVRGPDGKIWCETSDEEEARESMRPGDTLVRQWVQKRSEWRLA